MARVNVETRALAETRFHMLCQDLDMSRPEAIGLLVILWHDSQEREVWKADKERILKFIPYKDDKEAILNALLHHEYITLDQDGLYTIHGNKKHIDALNEKKEAGKLGGLQSTNRKKEAALLREQNKKAQADHKQPQQMLVVPQPNSMQFNALQFNTIQTTKPSFDFESLYGKYPRKLGKLNGMKILKRLVKNADDFKKVSDAIDRFIKYHLRENTGSQFIPHFSTFMNSISDWYDERAGSVNLGKPRSTYYPPAPTTDRHEPRTLKAQELRSLINSVVKPVDDAEPGPGAA